MAKRLVQVSRTDQKISENQIIKCDNTRIQEENKRLRKELEKIRSQIVQQAIPNIRVGQLLTIRLVKSSSFLSKFAPLLCDSLFLCILYVHEKQG